MTRVLHTIDTTGPGGAETVFVNLAKGLAPERFQSFAAITGPGWVCDELRRNGIEPIFVQARGGFNFRYLREMVRIVRKYKIDVIQSHLLGSNLYCSLAGLICRVPVILTFHGFVDSSGKDRLMPVKSRIINLASRKIVFVSDRLREHFIREYGVSAAKAVTIYNGVDTSVFKPQKDDSIRKELGLGPEHVLVGAIGNIRPAKGYDLFLKAARIIYEKHPECRFVVVGQGAGSLYASLLNLRQELNLEEIVTFLGFRGDAANVLNNLNIFVLPSISEGFSISTVEAMACAVPVVVTRSGGPEEIVKNEKNGISVECSYYELANAVIRLMEDSELKKNISTSYKEILKNFSLSKMVENYSSLYCS